MDTELKWTTETPKVPGYYWVHGLNPLKTEVVCIVPSYGRSYIESVPLRMIKVGFQDTLIIPDEHPYIYWCGPIRFPDLVVEE